MDDSEDWRLAFADPLFDNAPVRWKPYSAWSETWTHDHCILCWQTLSEVTSPEAVQWGYAFQGTGPGGVDDYHWVCEGCYRDFKDRFGWRLEGDGPEDSGDNLCR